LSSLYDIIIRNVDAYTPKKKRPSPGSEISVGNYLPFIGAWICFGTASSEQQPRDVRNASTIFGMLLLAIGVIVIIAASIVMASKHSKKGQVKLKAVTKTQAGTADLLLYTRGKSVLCL